MTDSVLLLAPSRDLGGGIERYVANIEAAFTRQAVPYRRLDLSTAGRVVGTRSRLTFFWEVTRTVRASRAPLWLVLAHRNLLPVIYPVVGSPNFRGATVIMHGCEIWSGRRVRGRRLLCRPDVRVVAGSNFSAGALAATCHATILHPGVSADWYDTLVSAGTRPRLDTGEVKLLTAFRLSDWRDKGLDTLLDSVRLLGDGRVRLTVCGKGPVPRELTAAVAGYPWCHIMPDLPDHLLARQLADADLFILATRTRHGASAYGEGFGLVLLEAQLAGTPVVAPAYGGSYEAFQHGLTGLVPIDESPQALAAVLATLLSDHQRRAEMGRAAAAWSRSRFEPAARSGHVVQTLLGNTPTLADTCQ